MMPTFHSPLKAIALAALIAGGGPRFRPGEDQLVRRLQQRFLGLGNSVGIRGSLPGVFGSAGQQPRRPAAPAFYGGYRMTNSFAIEGAQTNYGLNGSACGGDPLTGDAYRSCYGSAWSLSGVATIPFQSRIVAVRQDGPALLAKWLTGRGRQPSHWTTSAPCMASA